MLVFKDSAGEPVSVPKQVMLWAWPLLFGFVAWGRFGAAWGVLEGIAIYGWWLGLTFGMRGVVPWLRRHPITSFVLFVFIFTTLFFVFPTLAFGKVLSVWWCWAIGLSAGVIVTALAWPAQRRYWKWVDESLGREATANSGE